MIIAVVDSGGTEEVIMVLTCVPARDWESS